MLLEKEENIEGAIEAFEEALKHNPNLHNAAYAKAACENKRGNFIRAIEDYSRALEADLTSNSNIFKKLINSPPPEKTKSRQ